MEHARGGGEVREGAKGRSVDGSVFIGRVEDETEGADCAQQLTDTL